MSQPESVMNIDVEARRESPTQTTVAVRDFELTVDEPEGMGGTNEGPNPLEYLLAAQAGCLNVTGQQIASEMNLDINDLDLAIEGEFNKAAFAGEEDGRTGLQDIEVTMEVDADADEDTIETWAERVETHCPVSDNIKTETSVALSVERT
jgi:uncharacterized OsmC-like protein